MFKQFVARLSAVHP